MSDEVAARLQRLDAEHQPSVERFDRGKPIDGRVAVLPSAFNPPTLAHLHLLETAAAVERGGRAAALLSTRNVAKGVFGASLADRVGMLLAMHGVHEELGVLATNAARLVEQARALRTAFASADFDFVVGHDTLVRLFDPVYYADMDSDLREFFEHHRVIATNRGDVSTDEVRRFADERTRFASRIVVCEIHEERAVISSSEARATIEAGGHPVQVPPAVATYIAEHGLYRG
jgi:nicotinamide-nucleotide adenylyltransferase